MTLAGNSRDEAKDHEVAQLTLDPSGEIREANGAAHRLLGYPDGSLLGLSVVWLTPPSRQEVLERLALVFERSTPICVDTVLVREDGELLQVDLTFEARDAERGREAVIVIESEGERSQADTEQTRQTAPHVRGPALRPVEPKQRGDELSSCIHLLAWLDTHVRDGGTEDISRLQARVCIVLEEARALLESYRREIHRRQSASWPELPTYAKDTGRGQAN